MGRSITSQRRMKSEVANHFRPLGSVCLLGIPVDNTTFSLHDFVARRGEGVRNCRVEKSSPSPRCDAVSEANGRASPVLTEGEIEANEKERTRTRGLQSRKSHRCVLVWG